MIFFLKTAAKILKNHIKERWMGYCFFIPIILLSVFEFSHIILPPKLPASIYFLLATFEIGLSLLMLSEFSKEFHAMVISLFKSIRKQWLLQSEYELIIKDSDTAEIIKKKVNRYVDQEAAKQEKAFEKWKLELKFKQPNTRGRPILVFVFGLATIAIAGVIFQNYSVPMGELLKLPGYATSIAIFISAPVAYLIWMFRDQNNLWQIDNSRKDVNLKDFQRLSELACGTHFPECKDKDESYESRREAAQSLQVAAIYQLKEFMEGAYGSQFMRPSFLLLTSVWSSLVDKDQSRWNIWIEQMTKADTAEVIDKNELEQWRENGQFAREQYRVLFSKPLGLALHDVLVGEYGYRLRLNISDLGSRLLAGINHSLYGMQTICLAKQKLIGVRWDGASLIGINLQGANLRSAKFKGATLLLAKLEGSDLSGAEFQGARLSLAKMHGATLIKTQLQRSILRGANLQGADMRKARLQGADLKSAVIHKADLRKSNLFDADLRGTEFNGADLRGCKINANTLLRFTSIDAGTQFGRLAVDEPYQQEDDDIWIESDNIREEWIARGAVMVNLL
jgi:uncharacterized protein YjbI with pentapeptide repeats